MSAVISPTGASATAAAIGAGRLGSSIWSRSCPGTSKMLPSSAGGFFRPPPKSCIRVGVARDAAAGHVRCCITPAPPTLSADAPATRSATAIIRRPILLLWGRGGPGERRCVADASFVVGMSVD